MAFEFTDSNFKDTALTAGNISLVDFWAEWCGPCKMLTPVIEQLATEFDGKVKVGKLNVDNNPQTAAQYGVRSIPTILILKDGEIVDKQVGVTSKANLAAKLEAVLATVTSATTEAAPEEAPPSGPFEFTDANFSASALAGDNVSVIDFWAEWCGPCKALTPIIEELSTDFNGKATIGKLNVDNNPETAMKYGVRSIPTIIILKNGEIVDKHVGLASKAALTSKIEAALA